MATKKQNSSDVPEGSVEDVKTWVGDDPARAQQALDAEKAKPEGEQRVTLVESLEAMTADPAPAGDEVTGEESADDDTVLVEEEILAYTLPRHGARTVTTVAFAKGQRVSQARIDEVEKRNAKVKAEAEERAAKMDSLAAGNADAKGSDEG